MTDAFGPGGAPRPGMTEGAGCEFGVLNARHLSIQNSANDQLVAAWAVFVCVDPTERLKYAERHDDRHATRLFENASLARVRRQLKTRRAC